MGLEEPQLVSSVASVSASPAGSLVAGTDSEVVTDDGVGQLGFGINTFELVGPVECYKLVSHSGFLASYSTKLSSSIA